MSRAHQLLQQAAPAKATTNEARKTYFDDDAELYTLSDREIDRVTKTRAGYPMELVGGDSVVMQEYADEHPEGIVLKGGRRLTVTMTSDALAKFLKAARDGELSDELEDLASSVAETMKAYMDESAAAKSVDESLTDEDGEYTLALMLLVNAAKNKGYRKVSADLIRLHGDVTKMAIEMDELHDYFEGNNLGDHALLVSAIEQRLPEWRLQALIEVHKLLERRGEGGAEIDALRAALAGTEQSKKIHKERRTPITADAATVKLINSFPKDFQRELVDEYHFQL